MESKDSRSISSMVEEYQGQLPAWLIDWLRGERGLSEKVIRDFRLGWTGEALAIPVYGKDNGYSFFKFRRDPRIDNDSSKYWYSKGAGAEIYGWEHIICPKPSLIICEGELDRLILETHGLSAVTSTGGAGTFKEEWIEMLVNLPSEIAICYDNDDVGAAAAGKLAQRIARGRVVMVPHSAGVKDITDFITLNGIAPFKDLLREAKTYNEIDRETRIYERAIQKVTFPPISVKEVLDVLELTIKEDATNKIITFLCQLSAYTEDAQFNLSFNAPSSTGKSYIPIEISTIFPAQDVKAIGYCSPTAFFHDAGEYDEETGIRTLDLSRKILIFLDQPHTLLLQHLRPLLSHDKKEISIKITDKHKGIGMRTKNIIIKGYPSVIFCSAGLKMDEQEATRFLLLSPEINQEKIRKATYEKLLKESDPEAYRKALKDNQPRQTLKQRIMAIKEAGIKNIKIQRPEMESIEKRFFDKYRILKPRHPRDMHRIICLVKALSLLNLWHRDTEDHATLIVSPEDVSAGLEVWDGISKSQDLNLPPYIYNLYQEVVLPLLQSKEHWDGVTRQDVSSKYHETYERALPDWQLRREILPMLEAAGLIIQEPDPVDKRRVIIRSVESKKIK